MRASLTQGGMRVSLTQGGMRVSLTAATSLIALLVFGAGQAVAAPILAGMPRLPFPVDEPPAAPPSAAPPSAAPLSAASAGGGDAPLIDRMASPSTAYTYAPAAVPSAPDPGLATESTTAQVLPRATGPVAVQSRRNPGNKSNLTGTIGGLTGGLLARIDTRAQIGMAETSSQTEEEGEPATAFGAGGTDEATLAGLAPTTNEDNFVGRVTPIEQPGASAFVGQVDRVVRGPGVRRSPANGIVANATGAATATMVVVAEPDGDAANPEEIDHQGAFEWRGQLIGVARPPPGSRRSVVAGGIGTSTLGYTYSPVSSARLPNLRPGSTMGASAAGGAEVWAGHAARASAPAAISTVHVHAAPTLYQALLAQRLDNEGRTKAKREASPERFTLTGPAAAQTLTLNVPMVVSNPNETQSVGLAVLFGGEEPTDELLPDDLWIAAIVTGGVVVVLMLALLVMLRRRAAALEARV